LQHQPFFFSIFLLVVILIIISMLTGIVRLIFNIPKKDNRLAAFLWTIWALAIVFLIYFFVSREPHSPINVNFKANIRVESPIELSENQTLYIGTTHTETGEGRLKHFSIFGNEVIHNTNDNQYFQHPSFRIETTDKREITVQEDRYTIIPNFGSHSSSSEIIYFYTQNDTTLILSDYYSIAYPYIWNVPQVRITLFVPNGQKIYLDENMEELFETNGWQLHSENEILYRQLLIMRQGKLERML
jgi:hypothetical protein